MERRRLRTLVHISDVHFGHAIDKPGASGISPAVPMAWRVSRQFDGLLGHSEDACAHLEKFVRRLQARQNPLDLIMTGDLTACGARPEFELAEAYIERDAQLSSGRRVGLKMPGALAHAIPGNHDHWPGTHGIIGTPTETFEKVFPVLPTSLKRYPLDGRRELVLAGIDSDADIPPRSIRRFLAQGHFLSQLRDLETTLGPPDPMQVRVLLVHHSPMHKGISLVVSESSKRALDAFLAQRGISVILTGHVHTPDAEIRNVSSSSSRWNVLEARCGTTLQLDQVPPQWKGARLFRPRDDRLPPNTLLVHALEENDRSEIEWRTQVYTRSASGFRETADLSRRFPPHIVWPLIGEPS